MTLDADRLKGIWAALPVNWTERDEFDEHTYRANVRRICRAGVDGVYTHGTTGEFYAQAEAEWRRVALATVEESASLGVPCQVGCTATWTAEVIRRVEFARAAQAAAVQIAFPFWMELTDSQAVRFLQDVSRVVPDMPIVLYNTSRSKKPLTPPLLRTIVDTGVPLIGCKAAGAAEALAAFVAEAPGVKFFVSEHQLAPLWRQGARGCYCAFALACPRFMVRYYQLAAREDPEAQRIAAALDRFLSEFIPALVERGLYDSALDRCIASTTGLLQGSLLISRPPYDRATPADVAACRQWFSQNLPEFLEIPPQE